MTGKNRKVTHLSIQLIGIPQESQEYSKIQNYIQDKQEEILPFNKVTLKWRRQIYSGQAVTMVTGIHNTQKKNKDKHTSGFEQGLLKGNPE